MRTRVAVIAWGLLLVACGGHSPSHGGSSGAPSPISVPPVSLSGSSPSGASTSCAAGSITAPGAPFCYPLPSGFADNSSTAGYAAGWDWRTLVSMDTHDLIQVIGHPVQANLDTLTPVDALDFMQNLVLSENTPGVLTATTLTNMTIDGAQAFRQDAHYAIGVDTRNYTILRGHSVVSVSCQYTPSGATKVAAACDNVLATIVVADR